MSGSLRISNLESRIINQVRYWVRPEVLSLLAGGTLYWAAILADRFDLWKGLGSTPNPIWELDAGLWSLCVLCAGILYYFRWRIGNNILEELEACKKTIEVQRTQLRGWVKISAQISEVVAKKRSNAEALLQNQCTSKEAFKTLAGNEDQVFFILKMIHAYFKRSFTGTQMRLALFGKDPTSKGLRVLFSHDGNTPGCINPDPSHFLLDDPDQVKTEVVKTYLSFPHNGFNIVPDCISCSGNQFKWLKDEERQYLLSMLTFKHTFSVLGVQDALILSIDCNEAGFFKHECQEEYRQFLIEMMSRIEFELLLRNIYAKVYPI